jgi:genome maintenance exonuclease 1
VLPRKYEVEHLYDDRCGRLHVTATGTRPGVTTVLDKGGPEQPWLQAWKDRIGEAEAERIRLDATDRGTALHALIEANLTGQPVFIDPERYAFGEPDRQRIAAMFDKVRPALEAIDTPLGVELNCEWFIDNTVGIGQGFAGSIDCVATVDFEDGRGPVPVILDWKTAAKAKRLDRLDNYRMQVAAYRTAFQHTYPEFDQPVEDAVICIVPERGNLQIIHIEAPEFRSLEMSFASRLETYHQHFWHPAFGF